MYFLGTSREDMKRSIETLALRVYALFQSSPTKERQIQLNPDDHVSEFIAYSVVAHLLGASFLLVVFVDKSLFDSFFDRIGGRWSIGAILIVAYLLSKFIVSRAISNAGGVQEIRNRNKNKFAEFTTVSNYLTVILLLGFPLLGLLCFLAFVVTS